MSGPLTIRTTRAPPCCPAWHGASASTSHPERPCKTGRYKGASLGYISPALTAHIRFACLSAKTRLPIEMAQGKLKKQFKKKMTWLLNRYAFHHRSEVGSSLQNQFQPVKEAKLRGGGGQRPGSSCAMEFVRCNRKSTIPGLKCITKVSSFGCSLPGSWNVQQEWGEPEQRTGDSQQRARVVGMRIKGNISIDVRY